jgi:hypothetical protein
VTRAWLRAAPLVLAALAACAHVEPPPGGPEDRTPPVVASSEPESLSVVPGWTRPVVLRFSERISEQGAEEAVSVSPRTSPVQIDRGRDGIRVSLRGGWRPETIYHVTVSPEVRDLFSNRLAEPVTLVFSTGPAIPATAVLGTVTDRITGRAAIDTRVEAVRRADSLVYAVPTDSSGDFRIAHIPAGTYLLRAFRDANRNRALDGYEPRDSAVVEVGAAEPPVVPLAIVDPDSTAPRLTAATPARGTRVELRFDDYLDPTQPLDSVVVEIADSAGASVRVSSIDFAEPPAAPRDSAATPAPAAAPGAGAPPPEAAPRPPPPPPAPPGLPGRTLFVELAPETPLAAGRTYRVTVRGVRNVVGLVGESSADLIVPQERPAPPTPAP